MKSRCAFFCSLSFFMIILIPVVHSEPAAPGQAYEEISILLMSGGYTDEYQGIKDVASIQGQFKFIYTTATFVEVCQTVQNLGRQFRIKRMVFLGHGDPGGGLVDLGSGESMSRDQIENKAKALQDAGDTSLLDAFAENAEIVFFNCSVAKDPLFLPAAAQLFLGFSGGTVYGSDQVVVAAVSGEGRLIQWLTNLAFWNRDEGRDSVNFDSPSQEDYHTFRRCTVEPFLHRDFSTPVKVDVDGPDTAEVNEKVTLRAVLPDRQSIPLAVRPFLKSYWRLTWTIIRNGKERPAGNRIFRESRRATRRNPRYAKPT